MADDQTTDDPPISPPDDSATASQSMELPTVIMGERGDEDEQPQVRLLPGKIPKHYILYPAYAAVGLAAMIAVHFSLSTGEWHPLMVLVGWGLLYCWYWVYGIGYRYRRWLMKWFALVMSIATAGTLTIVTAVRAVSMAVPEQGELIVRQPRPMLFATVVLTTLSLAAVFTHAFYLGRGYRQKQVNDDNDGSEATSTP